MKNLGASFKTMTPCTALKGSALGLAADLGP